MGNLCMAISGTILLSVTGWTIYVMTTIEIMRHNTAKTTISYIQKHPNDNEYVFNNFKALKKYTETIEKRKYKTIIYEDAKEEYFLIDREELETGNHDPIEIVKQDSIRAKNYMKLAD